MTAEAITFQPSSVITFSYLMQVLLSLIVVLAIIYLIARYLLPKLKINATGRMIKVLDRVYLEPQVSAYILQVGTSAWLIAVSNKQVTRIDKIGAENLVS